MLIGVFVHINKSMYPQKNVHLKLTKCLKLVNMASSENNNNTAIEMCEILI